MLSVDFFDVNYLYIFTYILTIDGNKHKLSVPEFTHAKMDFIFPPYLVCII